MCDELKTFQVNEKVVYPSQGVGIIRSIEDKEFKQEKIPYYVIYLEVSDMTIMVPVHKAGDLGIRHIVAEEDARKALALIGESYEPIPSDWKMRYQMNLDLLKKGSVTDIAAIVRSLYHRSKVKELPILERKLYDSALKLLEDEVAFSLGLPKDEVEAMIFERLEPKKPEEPPEAEESSPENPADQPKNPEDSSAEKEIPEDFSEKFAEEAEKFAEETENFSENKEENKEETEWNGPQTEE
ncbi:MAG: CarD family transcriptional regulator [Spirochaetaceae bacterium]|jgi:CarD family transcriptional regulator|nr:CarD family transcriptional regulator [Spirochaetaceae bacterium]